MSLSKLVNKLRNSESEKEDKRYWGFDSMHQWFTITRPEEEIIANHLKKYEFIDSVELLKRLNSKTEIESISNFKVISEDKFLVESNVMEITETIDRSLPKVELPTGVFSYEQSHVGWGLKPYELVSDEYVPLSSHTIKIEKDIETFLESKQAYKDEDLIYKRGLILAGPPGCGKTTLIHHIAAKFKNKARIIFSTGIINQLHNISNFMQDYPLILVLEEFTEYGQHLLTFLDGEDSVNGVLVIGTTNYPQNLSMNLINRPGRFDSLYEVSLPDANTRRVYLEAKLGNQVTDEMINATAGLNIGYLKELVVASRIYKKSFTTIFEEFSERKAKIKKYISLRKSENPDCIWEDLYDDEDEYILDDFEEIENI